MVQYKIEKKEVDNIITAIKNHFGLRQTKDLAQHLDISPSARFCISEAEIVTALYKGISLLK